MIYKEVETKKDYRDLVKDVLKETDLLIKRFPEIPTYDNIYKQILDIENTIIINQTKLTENDLYARYTLGAMAVKNFDTKKDIYTRILQDIFGAAFEYLELPEN